MNVVATSRAAALCLGALVLTACATTAPTVATIAGDGTRIADTNRGLATQLTLTDVEEMADRLTNEMLTDRRFLERMGNAGPDGARIAVNRQAVRNTSDLTQIGVSDFVGVIEESLYSTGVAQVYRMDSPNWDYWLGAELVSESRYGTRGSRTTTYILRLNLNDKVTGARVGIWSDRRVISRQ